MATNAQIKAVITAEDRASATLQKFSSSVDQISKQAALSSTNASRSFRDMASNIGDSFGAIADKISSAAIKLAILGTASTFGAAKFVSLAGDLQNTQQSMDVLVGSTELANKVFGELYNYTLGKPIAFPTAALAAKTLAGYGIEADKVVSSMKDLGSISIATGADLGSLSLAYGQVNARGKLMGQEVLQLVNNSVPIVKILATHFHKSLTEMADDMQGGRVSAADFNQAIHEYVNGLDISKFSNTFKNRLISVQGSIRSFGLALLGIRIDPQLGMVIEPGGLFDRLSNFLPKISAELKRLQPAFVGGIGWLLDHGKDVVAIIGGITVAFIAARIAAIGFAIAAAANPIGLIATAITVLIGLLAYLQIKFNIFGRAWQFLQPVIEPIRKIFSEMFSILAEKLAPAFEFVSRNAEIFKKIGLLLLVVVLTPIIAIVTATIVTFGLLIGIIIAVVTAIQAMYRAGQDAIQFLVMLQAKILAAFGNLGGLLYNAGRDLINGLVNGIRSAISGLWSGIAEASATIGRFFANAGSWLYDTGKALISGLINGIKDQFGNVKNTLGDLTKKIKEWKGPAEVDRVLLTDNAKIIIGGFVKGLESQYGLVKDSLAGLTSEIPMSVSANSGNYGTPQQAPQTIQKNNSQINITIQAGTFMGTQMDARKFALYIQQALEDAQTAKGMSY